MYDVIGDVHGQGEKLRALLRRLGYRRCYAVMLALLGAGGLVGGLAPVLGLVLAMRVVEGLAAGVLQTIPSVIIMHAFARHEQGRGAGRRDQPCECPHAHRRMVGGRVTRRAGEPRRGAGARRVRARARDEVSRVRPRGG